MNNDLVSRAKEILARHTQGRRLGSGEMTPYVSMPDAEAAIAEALAQPMGGGPAREPTPAMASAGMHVLGAMPDYCDWSALAKYACVIWRAMFDASLASQPLPDRSAK